MSRRTTAEILEEALHHFELAEEYAARDLTEQIVVDAASMRLSAGIDTLSRLDDATRQRLFGPAWRAMRGMRNRIAHGYMLVDGGLVRDTLELDLPRVLAAIRAERQRLTRDK